MSNDTQKTTNEIVYEALRSFTTSVTKAIEDGEELTVGDNVAITCELSQDLFDGAGNIIPETLTSALKIEVSRTTKAYQITGSAHQTHHDEVEEFYTLDS